MVVVDAHCHAATFYYEPIESALDTMLRNGVEKALLIPLSEGVGPPQCLPDRMYAALPGTVFGGGNGRCPQAGCAGTSGGVGNTRS
jgi:hypothetical protein